MAKTLTDEQRKARNLAQQKRREKAKQAQGGAPRAAQADPAPESPTDNGAPKLDVQPPERQISLKGGRTGTVVLRCLRLALALSERFGGALKLTPAERAWAEDLVRQFEAKERA